MDNKGKLDKLKQDLEKIREKKVAYKEKISSLLVKETDIRSKIESIETKGLMKEIKEMGLTYEELLTELQKKKINVVEKENDNAEESPDEEEVEKEAAVI